MKNIANLLKTTLLVIATLSASCSERDIPEGLTGNGEDHNQTQPVYLDQKESLPAKESGFLLQIRTDQSWTIEVDQDWCTFLRYSGKGNASVMGTASNNTTEQPRSARITVRIAETPYSLTIQQKADGNIPPDPETPQGYAGGIEVPALKGGDMNLFVTHTTQYNGKTVVTYSYEWDCEKKHSRWVAFTFSTATPDNEVGRNDSFRDDPEIPTEYQTHDSDYKNSGYSRGHLCASSDRQYSVEANKQTFYFSNMSPQIQNGFNGGIWNDLEVQVQKWGDISVSSDTLYVAKGGTIQSDQIIEYIGNHVPVPKYYFMAILSLKGGTYHAVGFWLEHKSYSNGESYRQYALSIDQLEEKTGINFFANLPDNIENTVEADYKESDWSWLR